MTEMSVYKSVVKSNIMLRLMCFLLTLYVDVTFGDTVYRQVVDKVLHSSTFVSEMSVVLTWCNLSTVRDVWDPSSFVTSKCNRKLPTFDDSTLLSSSVDFDFDSLLCTSLYDSSVGACYLAHTTNRTNVINLMPDRPIPVAKKFCNDTKIVFARNTSNFVNGTRLWVEAFNKNIQDDFKCSRECIAGEKINPLCKAVVKLNSVILHLYNEVPQTHENYTGNKLAEPPAPPEKIGNVRTPSLDKISHGNSGLAEIRAGAVAQVQDDGNLSKKHPPVNVPSSSSKDNKSVRDSAVQNDNEQASRQLNGAGQKLHGNADTQNGKAGDSIIPEKGDLKHPLSSDKKTETHPSNGMLKFNVTHNNLAVNGTLVKPAAKTANPALTMSVAGSNSNPSAPSVQISDEHKAFPSLNNDNTRQHIQDSFDDNNNNGLQSGALPVATEMVQKPFQPQNTEDETQPAKKLKPVQLPDTINVSGKNTHPVTGREKEQLSNREKISEDKPEIDQEVPPATTVTIENVDKPLKMDSSVATGISNPATVNNQLQDTVPRDSTDETYLEPGRTDAVSDMHTLDEEEEEDDDDDDGVETARIGEDNVPPILGKSVLVSKQRTISKASFPIPDFAEEGSGEFVKAEDSHFFAYFMTMIVLCIIGYLVFHNKQKILALALEGRSRRGSRRRPNTAGYRKLDSNLEEAVTSQCSSASVTHVIY